MQLSKLSTVTLESQIESFKLEIDALQKELVLTTEDKRLKYIITTSIADLKSRLNALEVELQKRKKT